MLHQPSARSGPGDIRHVLLASPRPASPLCTVTITVVSARPRSATAASHRTAPTTRTLTALCVAMLFGEHVRTGAMVVVVAAAEVR